MIIQYALHDGYSLRQASSSVEAVCLAFAHELEVTQQCCEFLIFTSSHLSQELLLHHQQEDEAYLL